MTNAAQSDIPPEWTRRIASVTDALHGVQVERDQLAARVAHMEESSHTMTLLEVLQSLAEQWMKSLNIVRVREEARTLGKVATLMKDPAVAAYCHRWRTYPETSALGGPYTPDIKEDIKKWLTFQSDRTASLGTKLPDAELCEARFTWPSIVKTDRDYEYPCMLGRGHDGTCAVMLSDVLPNESPAERPQTATDITTV